MNSSNKKLPLDAVALLLDKMAENYLSYVNNGDIKCPKKYIYKIVSREEGYDVTSKARLITFKKIEKSFDNTLYKIAFDTRRINQEIERNPRTNLQYWHRQDEFIDDEDQFKIDAFSKLLPPLNELKKVYGADPAWHESYARVLLDSVERILRVKLGDGDFSKAQMTYLEQLLSARYQTTLNDLYEKSSHELKSILLKKDEDLTKRGFHQEKSNSQDVIVKTNYTQENAIVKSDNKSSTQNSIVNAIFGDNNFIRREGEKIIERTVTITIRDQVIDK